VLGAQFVIDVLTICTGSGVCERSKRAENLLALTSEQGHRLQGPVAREVATLEHAFLTDMPTQDESTVVARERKGGALVRTRRVLSGRRSGYSPVSQRQMLEKSGST
jgi:hypothetical protein